MPISVSDSKAEDNRQAIGDSGIGANKGSVAGRDKARVASKKSTIAEKGSTVVSGSGSLNTGLAITDNKGPVTIDTGGQMVADVALGYKDALKDLAGASVKAQGDTLKEVGSQLAGLAESKQTGGDAQKDSKVMYIALATVTALGVALYLRK